MDRQQEIQESFNHYFQSFFPDEGQSLAFLSSVASATEKANEGPRQYVAGTHQEGKVCRQ